MLAVSDAEALGVVSRVWETASEEVGLGSEVLETTSKEDEVAVTCSEDSELASGV